MSAASATSTWPDLSWTPASQRTQWLIERTKELAVRARAFELALEAAAEAGEAPLSRASAELDGWEDLAANVWMYVGLAEAKQVAAEDVGAHAEELAKIYDGLRERRGTILARLGEAAAAKVLAREAAAKVGDDQLKERAGELPNFAQGFDALGAAVSYVAPSSTAEHIKPITGDEIRQRQAQESKTLPDRTDFVTLLGALPPPWVQTVFDTIGLELPEELTRPRHDDEEEDEDDEPVELTVTSRSTIQKKLLAEKMNEALLQQIVFALEEEDRALLGELLQSGGALKYSEAIAKYGKDDADGFHWSERPPSGTVARLRRVGLAYVGMKGGKQLLVAPSDLLPTIKKLLEAPAE